MRSRRALATVLFTDIVGSTERASELGDRAWRELLARHHRIVRAEIRRWGGEEVTEAGDGFLAVFGSSARAVGCAHAARERVRVRGIGLEIRCGLHMGQIERQADGSAGGIAVHIGSRTAAEAEAGEIVVTSAIRDAETGSGFGFEDLGRRALKGVDRECRHPDFAWSHASLSIALAGQGEYGEAIATLEPTPPNPYREMALGQFYVAVGREEEARWLAAELAADPDPLDALSLVIVHAALGEHDEAARWLAFEPAHPWVPWLRTWPLMGPFRQDPRFRERMERLGLPPPEAERVAWRP